MKKRTAAQIPTNEPPRFYWELWRDRTQPYIPYFWEELVSQAMIFFLFLALIGGLALLWPADLAPRANVLVTPAGIKPEWYFLFMFQTLKLIPSKVWIIDGEVLGVLGCSLAGLFWLLLPFFENDKAGRTKAWITGLSVFALVYVVGMTVYGFLAK